MAQALLAGFVGIALGTGAGWTLVRVASMSTTSGPTGATVAAVEAPTELPPPTRTTSECGALEQERDSLRLEHALSARLLSDLRAELEGVEADWSDAIPPEHQAAAFRSVMADVALRCPDVDVTKIDCSEPPCQAWLTHDIDPRSTAAKDASDRLVNCPAWVEAYGERMDESSFRVCTETGGWGSVVGVRLNKVFPDSFDEYGNHKKRRLTRVDRARVEWPCGEP
jgi:hypothetical protein